MPSLNPSGESALTAWEDATQACLNYLASELGYTAGKAAFIGDHLPDNKAGIFAFIISGGPIQIQNFQAQAPARRYQANAALLGQFQARLDAMRFGGKVMNIFPVYKNPDNPGQATPAEYMKGRGLAPNVCVFEMTTHPEVFSRLVNEKKALWMIRAEFRVVYNTTQK